MAEKDTEANLLKRHIVKGESQDIEFKKDIPDNKKELANNVASFASCNEGIIYVGIDKNSNIVGLANISTPSEKDLFQLRLAGLIDLIEPKVRSNVEFFEVEAKILAKITVHKGDEPMYFVNHVPYVRILSKSRPATYDEVKSAFQHFFLDKQNNSVYLEQHNTFKELLSQLADIYLLASTAEEQFPRKDIIQRLFRIFEESLSEIRFKKYIKTIIEPEVLSQIITTLQELTNFQFYLGNTNEFIIKSRSLIRVIDPLIPQIMKNLSEKELQPEYQETLINTIEKFKTDWEWSKKYRIQADHLEKTRMNLRECAFNLYRISLLPNSITDDISDDLEQISLQIMLLSTPKGFGIEALGFDNIEHLTPKIELTITELEKIIAKSEKLNSSV